MDRNSSVGCALRRLAGAALLLVSVAATAGATTLTFEVFDQNLNFLPYNDAGVLPVEPGYGYLEGYGVPDTYGDNVTATQVDDGSLRFKYGVGAEGFTPDVSVAYGPFSIFTGGPELWREDYGDLNGVLYQGSRANPGGVGYDYDFLDIVLYAGAGHDVVLHSFDLGSHLSDRTINSVSVFDGAPFPLFSPINFLTPQSTSVNVAGGADHTTFSFGTPLQSPVIWIRIDASNRGEDSRWVGIDNIRFGEVDSRNPGVDPAEIDAALQATPVPEPASLTLLLLGGAGAALERRRRRRSAVDC
jgi:hypothetical protein